MLNLEEQIFHQLERAKNILLLFSSDEAPSKADKADAMAGTLALFLFLKKLKKGVDIVGADRPDPQGPLSFLPSFREIRADLDNLRRFIVSLNISQAKVSQIKYTVEGDQLNFIVSPATGWFKPEDVTARPGEFKYDLIITVGVPDLESLGKIYDDNIEFFYKTAIVNVDHHSANSEYGQINYIDINSVATSEIIYYLLKNYKPDLIDEDIATCLLTGLIEETRNFKTPNLTPRTLLTASELITAGARREEIVNRLYRSRSLTSLKLWGKILNGLKSERNGELLWSAITQADFRETGAASGDLNDIVDELIATVPTARIIAVLFEENNAKTRVLVYSLKTLNALSLLKEYGALGTIKTAQAEIDRGLTDVAPEIIKKLSAQLDKLTS